MLSLVSQCKTEAQLTRWKAAGSGEKRALVRLNQGRISCFSRRKAKAWHLAGEAAGSVDALLVRLSRGKESFRGAQEDIGLCSQPMCICYLFVVSV